MHAIVVQWLILLSWGTFWAYWILASFRAKGSVRQGRSKLPVLIRFVVIAVALAYFEISSRLDVHVKVPPVAVSLLGAVICALGVGFAIWARVCIGENWGMPMTERESPELVTSGPYAYVRHPIYSGMLLALLGTMLAIDLRALIAWPIALLYFGLSAFKEERDLQRRFPEQYKSYMKHSKRLVPMLW